MTLFTLTVLPAAQSFQLPANAPMTDIEYETGGKSLIPFGCRMGACGACVIKVIDGQDKLNVRHPEEEAFIDMLGYPGEEYRLACQCRLKGSVTIKIIR